MDIKYEILNFNPNNGSLTIKYFTDEFTDGLVYSVDVPIVDGKFASEDEVTSIIEFNKPKGQLERMFATTKIEPPDFLRQHIKIKEPEVEEDITLNTLNTLDADSRTMAIKDLISTGDIEDFIRKVSSQNNEI